MGYWNRTDEMIARGEQPNCPYCGKRMFPEDDHGRFACFCEGYREMESFRRRRYAPPQMKHDVPDEEKEKIPPINRLELPPTAAEKEKLSEILDGFNKLKKEAEKSN